MTTRRFLTLSLVIALFSTWSWAQTTQPPPIPVDYTFPLDSNGAVMNLVGGWTADDLKISPLPTLAPPIKQALQRVAVQVGQTWTVIKYTAPSSTSCQGTVQVNGTIYTAQTYTYWSPTMNDPWVITREMAIAMFTPCGLTYEDGFASFPLGEGQANAKASLALAALANLGVPGFVPVSGLGMFQTKLKQDFFAAGGGEGFDGGNGADLFASGALFEIFAAKMGNSFIPLDQLWEKIAPSETGQNIGDYIAAIDQAVGMVGDRMPSTWISLMPQYFTLNTQQRTALGWTTETDPTNGLWLEAYALGWTAALSQTTSQTIINPSAQEVTLRLRQDGNTTAPSETHTIGYIVKDSSGDVVYNTTFPSNLYSGGGGVVISITKDGFYSTQTFLYDNGVATNMLPGEFPVDSTGWSAGKLVVMSPGVKLYLAPGQSSYTLTYVDGTNIAAIGNLPASYTVVLLTDGTVTRPFVYVPSAPNGTMVWNWFQFDNPKLLAPLNAVTWTPLVAPQNQVSPGEWITLDTLGANHGDPDFTKLVNGDFPTTAGVNVWGSTQAVFSCGSQQWLGAMNYASAGQLNVQVPPALTCTTANVQVSVNGTMSNSWPVQVMAATPAIFLADAAQNLGAVTFATGQKIGELVTSANPAKPGDALSVFYTGCGPLSEALSAGQPAPLDHLIYATAQTVLTVGAVPVVPMFNGLAPGYVGLCQINFVVPQSAQTGSGGVSSPTLGLSVAGQAANQVVLPVQYSAK
jgi:uncharacterized protein (TIGR03437 family)